MTVTETARTALKPGEMQRFGAPPRTELRAEDSQRHAGAARQEIREGELRWPAPVTSPGDAHQQKLLDLSQRWVAQTFFGTLLRQMRNSPFKSDLFSGGRGGEVFQEMHDQHLAQRMAQGAGRGLATSIVKHLERAKRRSQSDEATKRPGGGIAIPRGLNPEP